MKNIFSSIVPFLRNNVFISTIVGNILDHYDTSLYAFLVPYIAPLFFPHQEPVVALIYTFGLMSASIITRPLGAWYFGKYAAEKGEKKAFIFSLWGVALTTGGIGILPTYNKITLWAPLGLAVLRAFQAFFAAGESIVAPLFMLKDISSKTQGQANGIYQSSTIFGILLASLAATFISFSNEPELYWRLPFLIGFLTGLVGLWLRYQVNPQDSKLGKNKIYSLKTLKILANHKKEFLKIIAVSSLSYVTYAIPFVFMNAFVIQVSNTTLNNNLSFNTILLAFDMCLLPFFGKLADRVGAQKIMSFMAILLALTSIPLFLLIPDTNIFGIVVIRLWIVLCGLGFSAPIHSWFNQMFRGEEKYLITGLGYSIGSEIFGRSTPMICLWLWHFTGWVIAPALYVMGIAFFAFLALKSSSQNFKID